MTYTFVDGTALVYRAFYGMPDLQNTQNIPVGALMGFGRMLHKIHRNYPLSGIIFDAKGPTHRHTLYPSYKAHRKAMPDHLVQQWPLVEEFCTILGLPGIKHVGYEADDILASYAVTHTPCVLVTSDKDLWQVLSADTLLLDPAKHTTMTAQDFTQTWQLAPHQWVDMQALMGDSTDNIPGVPGIGPKTAHTLIGTYGSLSQVYAHIADLSPRWQTLLQTHKDQAFLSYDLAKLTQTLDALPAPATVCIDEERLSCFCHTYNVPSLHTLWSVSKKTVPSSPVPPPDISLESWQTFLSHALQEGCVFIHLEDHVLYLRTIHKGHKTEKVAETLGHLWSHALTLVTHQSATLLSYGTYTYEDIGLMSSVLFGGRHDHDISTLQKNYGPNIISVKDALSPLDILNILKHLYAVFVPQLHQAGLWFLYYYCERPLPATLHTMHTTGIFLREEHIQNLATTWNTTLKDLEQTLRTQAQCPTLNLGSPKQLAHILYEHFGLSRGRKGVAGYASTSTEALEPHRAHPFVQNLLSWRKIAKLYSTYTHTFLAQRQKETGKIHPLWQSGMTATGRLVARHPNMQNIPLRHEEGRRLRQAFFGQHPFVSFDYSQIELRILAHMGPVPLLTQAFQDNVDVHALTAHRILGSSKDTPSAEERRWGKTLNFGILYGISAFGLAQRLGVSVAQGKEYIDLFFHQFPDIHAYITRTLHQAKTHGFVTTLWGRRCYIDPLLRGYHKRLAINAPLQGTSADLIKLAMNRIHQAIIDHTLETRIVMQIHDELVLEMPPQEQEVWIPTLKKYMEVHNSLTFPVHVRPGWS